MSIQVDTTFRSMGSDVRLMIGTPLRSRLPGAAQAADEQRAFIEDFAARLSRFIPRSELSQLNCDRRAEVPASALLRTLVRAAIGAAECTGGLVDPTLVHELEAAGYSRSFTDRQPASLPEALAAAPVRRAASPHPGAHWRQIAIEDHAGVVRRPPGLCIDSGGLGKGLAADMVALRLCGYSRFVVDCGGDLAVGGLEALVRPHAIEVEHPLTGETIHTLALTSGGVATSGLNRRVWRTPEGFAHHLLDPASGRPAWTGLIGATAVGETALAAEALAKAALLLGPLGARRVLRVHGGVVVHDDGDVELIGPVNERPRLRLRLASAVAS